MTQPILTDLLESLKNQVVTPGAPTAQQGQWLDLLKQITENIGADSAAPGIVRLATNTEAAAGTLTDAAVTPAGLAAAIASVVGVLPASTTVAGSVELATSAETITGTDTERAVTPAGFAAGFAAGLAAAVLAMTDTTYVAGDGPIIRSPDDTKYRVIVANGGALSTEAAR